MKTAIDNHDDLLARTQQHAKDTGQPPHPPYRLPDLRIGDPAADDPLERFSWPELRETTYTAPTTCSPTLGGLLLIARTVNARPAGD